MITNKANTNAIAAEEQGRLCKREGRGMRCSVLVIDGALLTAMIPPTTVFHHFVAAMIYALFNGNCMGLVDILGQKADPRLFSSLIKVTLLDIQFPLLFPFLL